jgi:NAD(P)-dependent dehydrogenase (short-subunit alcohol dehydrogenase family)
MAFEAMTQTMAENQETMWGLVNNAGIGKTLPAEWGALETHLDIIEVNTLGVMRVSRKWLPLLRKTRGRLVVMGSWAGRLTTEGGTAYSVSKVGVAMYSKGLRQELPRFGVNVVTIEPGFYNTPMTALEAQRKGLDMAWEQTGDEVKRAYGRQYYEALTGLMRRFLASKWTVNPDPGEVVDSIEESLTCSHPESVVSLLTPSSRLFYGIICNLLPHEVEDMVMKGYTSLFMALDSIGL